MNKEMQILLVEDHQADARLVAEALLDCEVPVCLNHVKDGEVAIQFLLSNKDDNNSARPDLIILDLNMPRKDGHEFLAEMKHWLDTHEVPVVLLTVSDRQEDVEKALEKKLNYYLNKPVDAEKLQCVISAINELWYQPSNRTIN